jgi:ElaB/YqjD/DUF883 family membrane-anchored ribosome-binding protein
VTLEPQGPDPAHEVEVMRHEVDETRSHLMEKVELIEHMVVDMVEGATGSVADTIGSMKESVAHTVDAVQEAVQETVTSVKHALDVRYQVRQHPWFMLGTALLVGFGFGRLLAKTARAPA